MEKDVRYVIIQDIGKKMTHIDKNRKKMNNEIEVEIYKVEVRACPICKIDAEFKTSQGWICPKCGDRI